MKSRRFAILALLISLVLHVVLFYLASRITLNSDILPTKSSTISPQEYQALHLVKPPEQNPDQDPLKPNWEDDSAFEVPEFQDLDNTDPLALKPLDRQEEILRQQTEEIKKMLDERMVKEAPVNVYQLNAVPQEQPEFSGPSTMTLPEEALEVTAPRIEILEIKADALSPERLTDVRTYQPDIEREFVPTDIQMPSLASVGELAGPPPAANVSLVNLQSTRPNFGISETDLAELYGPDPQLPGGDFLKGALPGIDNKPKPQNVESDLLEKTFPLDDYVVVTVSTYPDPAGPAGTFLVELRPAPKSASMPDISKDVLFIVDRSSSISFTKFQQFKKAVQEVLPALSPDDRFNIISFNEKQKAVFTKFVPGTASNIAEAQTQVKSLPHGGRTDVFGGVAPFVKQSNGDRNRPMNIFLLTDGQSTVNIYEPSKFLRGISGINPGNVSIFPFSAEKKANRMLLDFLGYLNKGEKCHVETTDEICDAMVRFYSDHSSLIVTDLRCAATTGADVNEIFPRSLPHLYRNQTLRLFGRYQNKADTLTLSITGRDAEGRLRDLVFRRKLDQCPEGAPTLPAQWAGQKILFLLARLNLSDNTAEQSNLTKRIEELKKQYSILSPY